MPALAVTSRALPQPKAPELQQASKLDIEEMRRSVRAMHFDDAPPAPMGPAFSAAPSPALEGFRQTFDSGKRPPCLTNFQGLGVLALVAMPLASLLDKKDHGCKW